MKPNRSNKKSKLPSQSKKLMDTNTNVPFLAFKKEDTESRKTKRAHTHSLLRNNPMIAFTQSVLQQSSSEKASKRKGL